MRLFAVAVICMMLFVATGCAKKTPAEQLKADMKKAGEQMNKDVNALLK